MREQRRSNQKIDGCHCLPREPFEDLPRIRSMLPDLEELSRWLPRTRSLFLTSVIYATLKISVTFNLLTVCLTHRLTPHQRFLPDHILEFLREAFRL